jgi:hypothetical protein
MALTVAGLAVAAWRHLARRGVVEKQTRTRTT